MPHQKNCLLYNILVEIVLRILVLEIKALMNLGFLWVLHFYIAILLSETRVLT